TRWPRDWSSDVCSSDLEDTASLLGAMLVTKISLAALSRADTPEAERRDFYLYVDEFPSFTTASFAGMLSEMRKYRLGLVLAHQRSEERRVGKEGRGGEG